jgi:uncharacterized protein (TIGR03435 family)
MERLVRQLSNTAGRPVLDKTGLAGDYAFTLEWTPGNRAPDPDSNIPSIFTARVARLSTGTTFCWDGVALGLQSQLMIGLSR